MAGSWLTGAAASSITYLAFSRIALPFLQYHSVIKCVLVFGGLDELVAEGLNSVVQSSSYRMPLRMHPLGAWPYPISFANLPFWIFLVGVIGISSMISSRSGHRILATPLLLR